MSPLTPTDEFEEQNSSTEKHHFNLTELLIIAWFQVKGRSDDVARFDYCAMKPKPAITS